MIRKALKGLLNAVGIGGGAQKGTRGVREALEACSQAVAFAEAGLESKTPSVDPREKAFEGKHVLVLGGEEGFSEEVMDYAVGFAARMGYRIAALSVFNVPLASTVDDRLYADMVLEFEGTAREAGDEFAARARDRGVALVHYIRLGNPDGAVKEICGQVGCVDFVISEPSLDEGTVAVDAGPVIPVYAMAAAA
ncbi:hypothetical protein SAMN02745206_02668 [Desulfacinum infernum DSM 9756]|uniref:Universal stress protein family protein n=1 Tax=Desulfacinum infernum DSM 9756 TaxID=1121391 RepID=A0A1M5EJ52_9BACT|nr:hypothetical protein [Desulfacinum infernum]SHF79227.1 hypothetical protein SAMN02745206_02668 [Desulfacinum infernum DSM 9756]